MIKITKLRLNYGSNMQFIQDFSEHRVYLALVITSAARGPGAESRAADRSPARRDAGGGSSLFIPFEANRLPYEAQLPICEADPSRHSIKPAKSAFLSLCLVRN